MKIELPITYPTITTFPPYSDALAILCSHSEALPWVYSQYIQTAVVDISNRGKVYDQSFTPCFFIDFDNRRLANTIADCFFLNRENCPFLNLYEIPNCVVGFGDKPFSEIVKLLLAKGMYIYGYIDVSKISDYAYLKRELFAHEVFIYGYNDSDNSFSYADQLNNETLKYKFSTCSCEELDAAFENSENLDIPIVKSFAAIQYVENAPFGFDFNYIRESIAEYVNPDPVKTRRFNDYAHSFLTSDPDGPLYWIPKVYMGTDVYNYFADYIDYEFAHENTSRLDHRLFHAMYDHKEMMIKRLDFLLEHRHLLDAKQSLIDEYKTIRDMSQQTRNLVLKYNMRNSQPTIDSIKSLLTKTKLREIELLSDIFDL
jgi:hypothetical protein